MTSLRATAKDLLERSRRPAGDCGPSQLARCAILSFVHHLQQARGWSPDGAGFPEACLDDPVLAELASQPDGIGRLWQAINEPALRRAFAAAGKGTQKFAADEIAAATQLFTPSAVVDYLLQSTLGRLWRERHPDSRLPVGWSSPSADVSVFPPPLVFDSVREVRLLDPACGTMNFLIAAVDLFRAMYREERDRAGEPGWPMVAAAQTDDEIDAAILRHNLFAAELDPFVFELGRLTLELKMNRRIAATEIQHFCGDALLDRKLDRQWPGKFHVVVTNPPYLSVRNVSKILAKQWMRHYPLAARDAYACFIDRSLQLLKPGGRAGLLTMQSFMFTGSYEPLRRDIAGRAAIESIAHFGPGLFDTGNPGTLQTVAFVARLETSATRREQQSIRAIRLVDHEDKTAALREHEYEPIAPRPNAFTLTNSDFVHAPRSAWVYWLTSRERQIIATFPKLRDLSPPRQGLATTDNTRFVRTWWEVAPFSPEPTCVAAADRWTPYVKAGQSRRWYEASRHRVNWEDDGAEIKATIIEKYPYLRGKWEWVAKNAAYYGRGGVTYSYLTSNQFSARQLDPGSIFDVAGSALFPADPLLTLAVLNSTVGRRLLSAINPTVNFQVGDLAELPMLTGGSAALRARVVQLIGLHQQLDQFDEATPDFVQPMKWSTATDQWGDISHRIAVLEREVDAEVAEQYDLPISPARVERVALDRVELAERWVSCAMRLAMADQPWAVIDAVLATRIRTALVQLIGDTAAIEVEQTLDELESYLPRLFAAFVARTSRSRPRWWVFGDRHKQVLIAHDRADRRSLVAALRRVKCSVPARWDRFVDDGIAVNLAPLRAMLIDRSLQRSLKEIAEAAKRGELAWSRTFGGRRVQSRIELRMRSSSDKLVARAVLLASSMQVNSAPILN